MQREPFCEHYKVMKLTRTIDLDDSSACRYCLMGKNHLWMCLAVKLVRFRRTAAYFYAIGILSSI